MLLAKYVEKKNYTIFFSFKCSLIHFFALLVNSNLSHLEMFPLMLNDIED